MITLFVLLRNVFILLIYEQIAIYGDSFCVSARNAYMLLMRNIGR